MSGERRPRLLALAVLRGAASGGTAWAGLLLLSLLGEMAVASAGLALLAVPYLMPVVRRIPNLARRWSREWTGIEISDPYLPRPAFQPGLAGFQQRCRWILSDMATWRDLLWLLVNPLVGGVLTLVSGALVVSGLAGLALPFFWRDLHGVAYGVFPQVTSQTMAWLCVPQGLLAILLGLVAAPYLLRLNFQWTRLLLAPSSRAELALRVRFLTDTRADAVDTSAAELRRIERDLHDGAQARLVAMGMNLGALEELVDRDSEAARALIAQTRESSEKALSELRDLVRGIHPPVLADRGLGDAIRALALDCPLRVMVTADVPDRLDPTAESAAYFAVSEVLANAIKYAGAQSVSIDVQHTGRRLRIIVVDDGRGGADPAKGSGLRGIERRLAIFDGVLIVDSPAGGPTTVTMELVCGLSSPKTTSC
jgi:signal transduction histidine kinase